MAVTSADEESDMHLLDEVIAQGCLELDAWISLVTGYEQLYPDDINKIKLVYDSFLAEFPLCYCYWKKYALHMARLCGGEEALRIFERAVEAAPYCVGLWVDYCSFGAASFGDPSDACRLFERGLSFVGKDYLCHYLWDKYIEFEYSHEHWNSLASIYIRILKFPTKKLHQYYESFKKLVTIWKEEMEFQGISQEEKQPEQVTDSDIVATDIFQVIKDMNDPSTRAKSLQKYISVGEYFYQRACDLYAKVQKFEQNIRRPYYHVKPLDNNQLQNWHQYLDLVEMGGDFDWAMKLYERCLISCADYPDFWMRYVDYLESNGGFDLATDALNRATHIFLKEKKEGKKPIASELFLDTHFKKCPGKEPQAVSTKAKEVMEKYYQNLSESQATGSPSDPNENFFDTVGGYRKGEVLGFGRQGASLYYEKRPRRHNDSDDSPSVSAKITQMSEELERTKAQLAEIEAEREAKDQERDEEIQRRKAQMDAFMRQFGVRPLGPGRFPDDSTDGSGASGAFVA